MENFKKRKSGFYMFIICSFCREVSVPKTFYDGGSCETCGTTTCQKCFTYNEGKWKCQRCEPDRIKDKD